MAKRQQVSEHGSPLIVRFPCDEYGAHSRGTLYFSVFEGAVHYWSRFCRVVVSYDTKKSQVVVPLLTDENILCTQSSVQMVPLPRRAASN